MEAVMMKSGYLIEVFHIKLIKEGGNKGKTNLGGVLGK